MNQDQDETCWREPDAESLGVSWLDYCRERDRVKLPSGGFSRSVWDGCGVQERVQMMEQLMEMRDGLFDMPKNWGTW